MTHLSISLSLYPSIHLSICLSVCLPVWLSGSMSLSLSVSLDQGPTSEACEQCEDMGIVYDFSVCMIRAFLAAIRDSFRFAQSPTLVPSTLSVVAAAAG
eukprot:GHVU01066736.1.p1 GENE.GHVU01066736.1~~GHVU01066736.1.p1  ORF type:complete len:114 (-),score=4.80 GHVU01066736.1:96-392(-)